MVLKITIAVVLLICYAVIAYHLYKLEGKVRSLECDCYNLRGRIKRMEVDWYMYQLHEAGEVFKYDANLVWTADGKLEYNPQLARKE